MRKPDHEEFDWASVEVVSYELDVRNTWPDEDRDLTPWVIDNLPLLGQKLGRSLEFVASEVLIGRFRADIVARDDAGKTVIIENQFGPSDHGHFGQIVLYACEYQADAIVWVSAGASWAVPYPLRPEHRRGALQRLNEQFAGTIDFFGVELQVQSEPQPIGEPTGSMLPRLDVVVKPDHA
ncbi:hypothetical protein ACIBQ6_34500 [Nonomuraea sp. NPDC049655]|uniref:hypothetical protein n=1 Tax=Nonomuraea sp. NPDC049655 TaxID=3364355 RepID=UPI0037BA40CB